MTTAAGGSYQANASVALVVAAAITVVATNTTV